MLDVISSLLKSTQMIDFLKKALSNKILWYMATRYLTLALQFISSVYIAIKLGTYYWGIWSFVLLLINIGYQLNWGIGTSITILLVQHKEEPEKQKKYIYNAFVLVILGMLPVLFFVLFERCCGIAFFAKYHLGRMIYGVFFVICFYYLNILLVNICRVKNRVFSIALNQSIFPVVCCILMLVFSGKILLYSLLYGYIGAMVISFFVLLEKKYISFAGKVDFSLCGIILKKGIYLFLYNACFILIILTTKMIISYFYPVDSFGVFAFAFNLASAALLLVDSVTFIAQAKMIDMLQLNEAAENLKRIQFLRQTYLICVTAIVYLAIPAFYIIVHFLPKYQESFRCFNMIILSLELYPVCYGYNSYLMAHNKEIFLALLSFVVLILNFIITWILAFFFHVPMEYCVTGIMAAYLFYAFAVNLFAEKEIFSTWYWKNIQHYLPLYVLIPFVLAIILQIMNSIHILWMPFTVFFILGFKPITHLLHDLMHFICNPNILDIKNNSAE